MFIYYILYIFICTHVVLSTDTLQRNKEKLIVLSENKVKTESIL